MNCEETLKIIEALRIAGAVKFKSPALELELNSYHPQVVDNRIQQAPVQTSGYIHTTNVVPQQAYTTNVVSNEPPANEINTKRILELIDLLKQSDEQLVDNIFPAGA